MLTREKALEQLVYLEHGAHYAIGSLGFLMLLDLGFDPMRQNVPEWLSGLLGALLLVLSMADSLRHQRRRVAAEAGSGGAAQLAEHLEP